MDKVIDIPPFTLDQITPGQVVLVLGNRGSKKDPVLEFLKTNQQTNTLVFDANRDLDDRYKSIVGDMNVISEFSEFKQKIQELFQKQKMYGKGQLPNGVLVFEDLCSSDLKHEAIHQVVRTGKSLNITSIILAHSILSIPPPVRATTDWIMMNQASAKLSLRVIHEDFGCPVFQNFEEFSTAVDEITSDGSQLLCVKTSRAKPPNSLFYYKINELRKSNSDSKENLDSSPLLISCSQKDQCCFPCSVGKKKGSWLRGFPIYTSLICGTIALSAVAYWLKKK